ncbi:unnamed protein product [Didymodactylos carnosus]|uniref:Uncharacterized protein n=1 Tax=Didymodactylos carnosus TaxID=1234261 RepID=A0A816C560_9BILA|nr:unnamed protein product [Didymodactylos carnosus]CAF1615968.1 unnamed protein product [Didymodactylos carnosus]CAF4067203.1 unnamed protein product [Didymodactylos carnosus]CAF4502762.1 unnamed protein product [Didymodactylos carnosus]
MKKNASQNGRKIQSQYTLRNKLSLSVFLPTTEQMLMEWSNKSVQIGFATFPTVTVSQEREAWQWLQNIDKNSIFHCYGQC